MSPVDRSSHTTSFDDDERPSDVVVTAVAALTDTSPIELPPLYDAVDPDALDALFSRGTDREGTEICQLSFEYHGFEVHVRSDGRITFVERSKSTA